jgi:hypothetical protein
MYKNSGYCQSIDSYGMGKDADGNPLIADCQKRSFTDYFTSPENLTVFRALYENNFNMTDRFLAYWEATAKALSANQYVVGFDPINEPYPSYDGYADY